MKNKYSFIAGAALALSVGSVNAEQPMTLDAEQLDQVSAGGFAFVEAQLIVNKFKQIFEETQKLVNKQVNSQVNVSGWLSDAEAGANCFGLNCLAETLTITDSRADLFTATAFSESLSAASPLDGVGTAP